MEKHILIDYSPRECFVPYHESDKRYSITIAHRRAGKTVARINKLIKEAAVCQKPNPRFGYLAPYYIQAKDIAWSYLKHYAAPITALGGKVNESELSITFAHNNANIRLYGAENAERLRGLYFDGLVGDEGQDIPPYVLTQIIYPALADRQGWLDLSGTPKGWGNLLGETFKLARTSDEWFVQVLKASETNIIPEDELARLKRAMSDNEYAQEFECSFDAAIVGAYYAEHIKTAEEQGRITAVPLEGALSVHTAWDLGMGDDTAIWCYQQSPGGQVRVIDYIENHGVGLDWYVREIKDRALKGNWVLGEHLLPHDVEVRELGTGRSRFDTLVGLGIRPNICPKLGIDDGINAVRVLFPRLWFDTNENVQRGLDALRQYRREYDEKRQVFYEKPLHNWTSHAADAMRYLAVGLREASSTVPIRRALKGIV
jgi:phage terminase large subunit